MIIAGMVQGQPQFAISTQAIPRGVSGVYGMHGLAGGLGLESAGGFNFGEFIKSITVPAFDLVKTIVAPPSQVIRNADGSTMTVRTPTTVQTGAGPTTAQSVGQAASSIASGINMNTLLLGGGALVVVMMMMNNRGR